MTAGIPNDANVLDSAQPAPRGSAQAESREALDAIAQSTVGVVDAILARHRSASLTADDAAEIRGTVMLRLVDRVIGGAADGDAVRQPENLAATLTFNAINDHLRERFPERARLRARLRYVLTHDPRLATWESEAAVRGLASWRGQNAFATPTRSFAASTAMADRAHPATRWRPSYRRSGSR